MHGTPETLGIPLRRERTHMFGLDARLFVWLGPTLDLLPMPFLRFIGPKQIWTLTNWFQTMRHTETTTLS